MGPQRPRKKVTVSDGQGNQVAVYIRSPGFDHILSTYEYDEADRLVRILPPVYHERAGTLKWPISWAQQLGKCSEDEPMTTTMTYDKSTGNVITKRTPDAGTFEFIYSNGPSSSRATGGRIIFVVHFNDSKVVDGIKFFEYND